MNLVKMPAALAPPPGKKRREQFPKNVTQLSDKNCGNNKQLEQSTERCEVKAAPGVPKPLYSQAEIEAIFRRFAIVNPKPESELQYTNHFTLLVAVVLSAQATDIGVNKATRALFQIADTPQKMLVLGVENLSQHIRTIGLWRAKAKNVIALSKALIERFDARVPASFEALISLPGVGRKTANVVLNVAFQQQTLAVDTHIFRLANRLALAPGKTPEAVETKLLHLIPEIYLTHAHHWLILHGRYICKARKPQCPTCLIADLCKSPDKI